MSDSAVNDGVNSTDVLKLFGFISIMILIVIGYLMLVSGDSVPAEDSVTVFPAQSAALTKLAETLDLNEEQSKDLIVVSNELTTWDDSCLGFEPRQEPCQAGDFEGHLIIMQYQDKKYEAHTDETGSVVLLK